MEDKRKNNGGKRDGDISSTDGFNINFNDIIKFK